MVPSSDGDDATVKAKDLKVESWVMCSDRMAKKVLGIELIPAAWLQTYLNWIVGWWDLVGVFVNCYNLVVFCAATLCMQVDQDVLRIVEPTNLAICTGICKYSCFLIDSCRMLIPASGPCLNCSKGVYLLTPC